MALPKDHWTRDRFRAMVQSVLDEERMRSATIYGWTSEEHKEWAEKKYLALENKQGLPHLTYLWLDIKSLGGKVIYETSKNSADLYFDPHNDTEIFGGLKFRCGDAEIFQSYVLDELLPINENYKVGYMLNRWRKMIKTLEPEFVAIDHHHNRMRPRKGEDIRRFAWAAMYYGPDMVQKVGPERLASCPYIYDGDELLPGGLFFRAENNPFLASKEKLKAMEKHLDLKNIFPIDN